MQPNFYKGAAISWSYQTVVLKELHEIHILLRTKIKCRYINTILLHFRDNYVKIKDLPYFRYCFIIEFVLSL